MKRCYPLIGLFLFCQSYADQPPNLQFESAEHIFIGDQARLKGLPAPAKGQSVHLTLANGLTLTYGDIVAMPDYYGDPHHQISSERTFEARKQQFAKLFNSFAHYDTAYFNAFWPIVQDEQKQVADALKKHQSISELYKKIMPKEMLKLDIVTKGKFINLASHCMDHFAQDAWLAYQAGHAVAVDAAIKAHDIVNGRNNEANKTCQSKHKCLNQLAQQQLALAYEENGYANHFLTDRMAAGHMRTPFRALLTTRPIPDMGGIAGSYMHGEDNRYGVIVTNNSGKYWMAYGDDYYFSPGDTYHRSMIQAVVQKSADEIYDAYAHGYDTDSWSLQLKQILPTPISPGRIVNVLKVGKLAQSAPLFKVVAGAVWERKNVNDRHDQQWVQTWTTLRLMLTYKLNKLSDRAAHFDRYEQS